MKKYTWHYNPISFVWFLYWDSRWRIVVVSELVTRRPFLLVRTSFDGKSVTQIGSFETANRAKRVVRLILEG